MTEKKRVKKLP